ncbi:MAG: TolC family protein [Pseudomonadales bacterium]|nr:TolC family protein [Pseudomonadales bacterium]
MTYFQRLVRPVIVPFFVGCFLSPSIVLAESDCQVSVITDAEMLVRLALACNAGQQAIGERLAAQRYRAQSVGQLDDPKLMLGVAPQTFGEDRFDDGYIVELRQPLPWPGVLSLRGKAADAQSDVWLARQSQGQVRLASGVRLAYAQWQYHRKLLSINQRHRALWQEFIAVVRAKYGSGTSNKSAVLQATHEHHLLLQEAIELKANIERDASKLRRLANLPTTTNFTMDSDLPLTRLPTGAFDAWLSVLDRQPAMRGLNAQKRQKNSELALAEKNRYPNFSAMARYNSLWMNDEQRWVIGVSFNLPFDFGKRSNREDSLHAEKNALRWEQQDLRVQLREQLMQAHSFWQQAIDVHRLYENDLLPLAEESLTTARDEYRSGSGDFLSLLTGQRQLLATERKTQMALRDQYAHFAGLTASAGLVQMTEWNEKWSETRNTPPKNDGLDQGVNTHE